MTKNGIFVTGTDTGAGKTALAATLLSALARSGKIAYPMKPVQTGGDPNRGIKGVPDLQRCLDAAGITVPPELEPHLAPYCFSPAVSPHMAAEKAGEVIKVVNIEKALAHIMMRAEVVVVEGAGGVLVPLENRTTMRDLMVAIDFPVLVAARPGLGTLNHTLLSIEALTTANLEIAGIVLVGTEKTGWGPIEANNKKTLEFSFGIPLLGCIPFCHHFSAGGKLSMRLEEAGDEILSRLEP